MIDYLAPPPSPEESVLRRLKGNFRREVVGLPIREDGLNSISDAWKAHNISEVLKNMLQGQHPQAQGGEDLPDLEEGEVEIPRLTLATSGQGGVKSWIAGTRASGAP